MTRQLVAAIQMNSGSDEEANWARACALAGRARERGARLVAFPENLLYEGPDRARRHPLERWEPRFAALARELEVTLVAGTVREPRDGGARAHNTAVVIGPDGALLGRYRKIHLFDVDVPGGPCEQESSYLDAGREPLVVDAPGLGPLGVAICYDLRFPELFRALVGQGARTLCLPSSFALGTGKDHWLTLLRARAIENLAWVIAPDQAGQKPHGRVKYGKTAIIDPWGQVVALAREADEDVVVAEVDLEHQDRLRRGLPCLDHRRL